MNCPLIAGNPAAEQSICWYFANRSSVEYCEELNKTITLFDLLANDSDDFDLASTAGVSNNDEDNALDVKEKDKDAETGKIRFCSRKLGDLFER